MSPLEQSKKSKTRACIHALILNIGRRNQLLTPTRREAWTFWTFGTDVETTISALTACFAVCAQLLQQLYIAPRGVQYMHCMMHKCAARVKVGEEKHIKYAKKPYNQGEM